MLFRALIPTTVPNFKTTPFFPLFFLRCLDYKPLRPSEAVSGGLEIFLNTDEGLSEAVGFFRLEVRFLELLGDKRGVRGSNHSCQPQFISVRLKGR
ncbi:hypothetical protein AVEN_262740-1 [Araneus ventricosus]|uniref:Uncharacterized protein n=1 Tax=Araneus ventricosus TaxID=182803 RepID=A0A4Y2WEF5_ARAVE|nr:hypothetical protein AVEN_262740-1 [Araneus ventricosus]